MRVTGLGHASVLIETRYGRILTDPWVNPAYFGSWFPYPDNSPGNSGLDWDALGQAEYLYVSHLHRDHFDPEHLAKHIGKDTRVLLPAYATTELRDRLADLGFRHFVETVSDEVLELEGGLQVMVQALTSPTDGPIGDSSLWVSDGEHTVLNQNDARPGGLDVVKELGPVDAYLIQFSGAIWYPMVYELPTRAKQALGETKRDRQFDRTLRYIDELGARYVYPTAGPPCFLDPDLWDFNDFGDDPGNIFPDQSTFLAWLAEQGHDEGRLLLPGSTSDLAVDGAPVRHVVDPATVFGANKPVYLKQMQARRQPEVEAMKATWAHPEIDLLAALQEWFHPLLAESTRMAAGINGGIRIVAEAEPTEGGRGTVDLIVDFVAREVRAYDGEKVRYEWRTRRAHLEQLVHDHEIDWVNSLFLSCRFSAKRIGPYNEFVYTFFKCLSDERLNYAEGWYEEQDTVGAAETIELDGWEVQRRCPHLKADLSRFGDIEDGTLTCTMHGWKWDLASGRCLTSVGKDIRAARIGEPVPVGAPPRHPAEDEPGERGQHEHEGT